MCYFHQMQPTKKDKVISKDLDILVLKTLGILFCFVNGKEEKLSEDIRCAILTKCNAQKEDKVISKDLDVLVLKLYSFIKVC